MSQSAIPESRVYRHTQCNSETTIGDNAFKVASNPLSDMTRTWCSQCSTFFPVSEFEWADSGETITDYCVRHGAKATGLEPFLCSKKFLVIFAAIGALLGGVVGFLMFRDDILALRIFMVPFTAFVGVFCAGAIAVFGIEKAIVWRVCGVTDTRVLK
jgi:hypothetical protein